MSQLLDTPPPDTSGAQMTTLNILAACPDQPGIIAAFTSALAATGANIRELSQFSTNAGAGMFFVRLAIDVPDPVVHSTNHVVSEVAARFGMEHNIWPAARRKRMAVLCSTGDHCVLDLLWRAQTGELAVDVPIVISNHATLRDPVEQFGVPFVHVPATAAIRPQAEQQMLDILREHDVDFVVLARYMQILTDDFLLRLERPVINIHHSLLPAFVGAQPYQRAFERGVKIIGATAHYATPELDAGPIIEQGVDRVGHTADTAAMQQIGKNVEQRVLARAVALHSEDRVHIFENRTILHV